MTEKIKHSSLNVNAATVKKFAAFCKARGLKVNFAAEQALSAWIREQVRTETKR